MSYRFQIWYTALYGECRAGPQIIFPKSGRGLGHVTPTIFGIRSHISSKLLQLVTSNLVRGFVLRLSIVVCMITKSAILITVQFNISCPYVLPLLFDCRVLRTIFTVRQYTVGYPSDSLASCFGTNRFLIIIRLPVGCH